MICNLVLITPCFSIINFFCKKYWWIIWIRNVNYCFYFFPEFCRENLDNDFFGFIKPVRLFKNFIFVPCKNGRHSISNSKFLIRNMKKKWNRNRDRFVYVCMDCTASGGSVGDPDDLNDPLGTTVLIYSQQHDTLNACCFIVASKNIRKIFFLFCHFFSTPFIPYRPHLCWKIWNRSGGTLVSGVVRKRERERDKERKESARHVDVDADASTGRQVDSQALVKHPKRNFTDVAAGWCSLRSYGTPGMCVTKTKDNLYRNRKTVYYINLM